ncbi:hypothetical protein [Streptomyces xiaopingdaonensis]|uniref:hypothetical protein n=1 Tax=Streptomyces xiaopingdaonensis TaxID=1565415 RepID=UPI0002F44A42|nr:hypothetical protein [Streptomyces xiaopingdaonensis]
MIRTGWYELSGGLGPFDLQRGDRVLHGGRWVTVVDLYAPGSSGHGRVLHLDDGRLHLLRPLERVRTYRRSPRG